METGKMNRNRIKYYSKQDMASGYNLQGVPNLLHSYDLDKQIDDINDAIEIYNIKQYFDNGIYLLAWTTEETDNFTNIVNEIFKKVGCFFTTKITDENISEFYEAVDWNFPEDWWTLIANFNVHKKISEQKFKELISGPKRWLRQVLPNKKVTQHFGNIIKTYMIDNPSYAAELLLSEYEMQPMYHQHEKLYFPKELTNDDKVNIISDYIDSEKANLKHLDVISKMKDSKDKIIIPVTIRLKATKKFKSEMEKIPTTGVVMQYGVGVSFVKDLAEIMKIENVNENRAFETRITYSEKWVKENNDFATLLNNFIYLLFIVDKQMRCTLVSKVSQIGEMEKFFSWTSHNFYLKGNSFDQENMLSLITFQAYYQQLNKIGVRVEEIIEWFLKDYLKEEFNAEGFQINMPSEKSYFYEKCGLIMSRLESVLKQFSLFVENGELDVELLNLTTEQLIYEKIPSLIPKKYVYGKGTEYGQVSYLFFSDQSVFSKQSKRDNYHYYDNFFQAISTEKFKKSDFQNYEISSLEWLIEQEYLTVDTNDFITFKNPLLITILSDIYFNDVCCYWRYSEQGREVLDFLKDKDIIEFGQTLFSIPEQKYISFVLKRDFSNGLDLRNKYAHTDLFINEESHLQNYMIFLRLFILVVIKINDDFCMFDKFKNEIETYNN